MEVTSIGRSRRTLAACLAAATLLVACGSDDAGPVEAPSEEGDGEEASSARQETGTVSFEPGTQLAPLPDAGGDPAIGTASPVVEGERFDGSAITIGGPTDQPTLYVFLAHWCPHCNDEIPKLIELDDEGGFPADLEVIGISTGADPSGSNYPPSTWLEEKDWPWDVMADDENLTAIQVFGGNSFPYAVIVDADGTVLSRRSGTGSTREIANWVESSLA